MPSFSTLSCTKVSVARLGKLKPWEIVCTTQAYPRLDIDEDTGEQKIGI